MWSIKLYAHLLFKHSLSHGVTYVVILQRIINTLRSGQNGLYFPDDILKCIFMNDNVWISLNFSLKFVPRVSIDNTPALVQIMAWRRPGDKPLSEPMMISLLTYICVAGPQWVLIRYNTYMSTEQIVYVCMSCLSEIVVPTIRAVVTSDELAPRGIILFVTWIKWGAALFIFKLILFHPRSFNQKCYIFCYALVFIWRRTSMLCALFLVICLHWWLNSYYRLTMPYMAPAWQSETNYEMHCKWIYKKSLLTLFNTGTTCEGSITR